MTYEGYKKGDIIDAPDLWLFGAKVLEVNRRVLTVETYGLRRDQEKKK